MLSQIGQYFFDDEDEKRRQKYKEYQARAAAITRRRKRGGNNYRNHNDYDDDTRDDDPYYDDISSTASATTATESQSHRHSSHSHRHRQYDQRRQTSMSTASYFDDDDEEDDSYYYEDDERREPPSQKIPATVSADLSTMVSVSERSVISSSGSITENGCTSINSSSQASSYHQNKYKTKRRPSPVQYRYNRTNNTRVSSLDTFTRVGQSELTDYDSNSMSDDDSLDGRSHSPSPKSRSRHPNLRASSKRQPPPSDNNNHGQMQMVENLKRAEIQNDNGFFSSSHMDGDDDSTIGDSTTQGVHELLNDVGVSSAAYRSKKRESKKSSGEPQENLVPESTSTLPKIHLIQTDHSDVISVATDGHSFAEVISQKEEDENNNKRSGSNELTASEVPDLSKRIHSWLLKNSSNVEEDEVDEERIELTYLPSSILAKSSQDSTGSGNNSISESPTIGSKEEEEETGEKGETEETKSMGSIKNDKSIDSQKITLNSKHGEMELIDTTDSGAEMEVKLLTPSQRAKKGFKSILKGFKSTLPKTMKGRGQQDSEVLTTIHEVGSAEERSTVKNPKKENSRSEMPTASHASPNQHDGLISVEGNKSTNSSTAPEKISAKPRTSSLLKHKSGKKMPVRFDTSVTKKEKQSLIQDPFLHHLTVVPSIDSYLASSNSSGTEKSSSQEGSSSISHEKMPDSNNTHQANQDDKPESSEVHEKTLKMSFIPGALRQLKNKKKCSHDKDKVDGHLDVHTGSEDGSGGSTIKNLDTVEMKRSQGSSLNKSYLEERPNNLNPGNGSSDLYRNSRNKSNGGRTGRIPKPGERNPHIDMLMGQLGTKTSHNSTVRVIQNQKKTSSMTVPQSIRGNKSDAQVLIDKKIEEIDNKIEEIEEEGIEADDIDIIVPPSLKRMSAIKKLRAGVRSVLKRNHHHHQQQRDSNNFLSTISKSNDQQSNSFHKDSDSSQGAHCSSTNNQSKGSTKTDQSQLQRVLDERRNKNKEIHDYEAASSKYSINDTARTTSYLTTNAVDLENLEDLDELRNQRVYETLYYMSRVKNKRKKTKRREAEVS